MIIPTQNIKCLALSLLLLVFSLKGVSAQTVPAGDGTYDSPFLIPVLHLLKQQVPINFTNDYNSSLLNF